MSEPVVIVGAGLAGYNLARDVRPADADVLNGVVDPRGAGY